MSSVTTGKQNDRKVPKRAGDLYRSAELISSSVLVVTMVVVLTAQVFFRYVVRAPLYWSEELARFVLIWSVFVGAGFAVRRGSHMSIDVVSLIFPRKAAEAVDVIGRVIMTLFFVAIAIIGWRFAVRFSDIQSAAMGLPLIVVYMILPITSAVNILFVWLGKYGPS